MFYRIQQFVKAIFPRLNSVEIQWALSHLSPEASKLFLRQARAEQRHAIDVTHTIIKTDNSLPLSDFKILITAALLHDCGKSLTTVRLWHRIFIVLMQKMPRSLWHRLELGHTIFAPPLIMAAQHALWGENLARQAGLNSQICLLIREHHSPQTDLGKILAQADSEN